MAGSKNIFVCGIYITFKKKHLKEHVSFFVILNKAKIAGVPYKLLLSYHQTVLLKCVLFFKQNQTRMLD